MSMRVRLLRIQLTLTRPERTPHVFSLPLLPQTPPGHSSTSPPPRQRSTTPCLPAEIEDSHQNGENTLERVTNHCRNQCFGDKACELWDPCLLDMPSTRPCKTLMTLRNTSLLQEQPSFASPLPIAPPSFVAICMPVQGGFGVETAISGKRAMRNILCSEN